ncbi:Glycosyltransferase [Halorhabdus sp. BNX81]|nr:Glycosyltransferase [Halorhabdus sp. BNX81]
MTGEPPTVTFISPWNRNGGLATYSRALVPKLRNSCDVAVVPWDNEPIHLRGSGIALLNRTLLSNLFRRDVVHVQYAFGRYLLSFPLLLGICILLRTRVVMTQHERFDNLPAPTLLFLYHQLLYCFVDTVIVHTDGRKQLIWKRHHPKVTVIEHGVVARDNVDRHPREIDTILLPGGIRPIKGHEVVISALPSIENVELRIVGGIGNEEYFREIRSIADQLGVNDRIEWVTEFVPEETLFEAFQEADVVVLAYEHHTSMSGILSHTLSWHVPAIVTDCPAFRHMIECEDAFLAERDGSAVADRIRKFDSEREVQRRVIDAFAQTSRQFSWESVAGRTTTVYAGRSQNGENQITSS